MELHYTGNCSLAAHIVAREVGVSCAMEKDDLATKKAEGGVGFLSANPNVYVPVLLPDGEVLAETPVVLRPLADQKPGSDLQVLG